MMKRVFILLLSMLPLTAFAAGGGKACGAIDCDPIATDMTDLPSLQRGAMLFTNYCMGCHGAKFSRYERVATDLGIPEELMKEHLIFDKTAKYGDLMKIGMTTPYAKAVFGTAPPDLTMVTRVRSPEWVYTYLRNFYADPARPYGVNNKVFPNVGMPHVLLELQGMPECAPGPVATDPTVEHKGAAHGITIDPLSGEVVGDSPCGSLKVRKAGSMNAAEFDQAMYDLVNFMAYTADPTLEKRKQLGVYVLFFLAFLFVFVYLLNREYWKDIH